MTARKPPAPKPPEGIQDRRAATEARRVPEERRATESTGGRRAAERRALGRRSDDPTVAAPPKPGDPPKNDPPNLSPTPREETASAWTAVTEALKRIPVVGPAATEPVKKEEEKKLVPATGRSLGSKIFGWDRE